MPEPPTVTEREAVRREREAYLTGWFHWAPGQHPNVVARYPLPKVTRPRVVEDESGYQWRCNAGQIEGLLWNAGLTNHSWRRCNCANVTPDRVRLWADLLANPTEEVEE